METDYQALYEAQCDELATLRAEKLLLPDNLLSHQHSWLAAMERLVELEPESVAPDEDEKGFWRHELKAMRDMYMDLARLTSNTNEPD